MPKLKKTDVSENLSEAIVEEQLEALAEEAEKPHGSCEICGEPVEMDEELCPDCLREKDLSDVDDYEGF